MSLFANEARVPVAAPESLLSPASGIGSAAERPHSRLARLDFDGLDAVRQRVQSGQASVLRLNLLHGVEFEATVERSAPTATGYSLSGPLAGVPFGRMVLVVNGGHAVGRVHTPNGVYAIRTTGGYQSVERMALQPMRCATEELAADAHTHESLASRKVPAEPGAGPQDDEAVDVLVVYPSWAREIEGGYEHMLGIIDLDIATANDAYAASGVDLRVELAAAVEVEYDDRFLDEARVSGGTHSVTPWRRMLERLTEPDDGHLDEVHALRERHAADLVLLHLGGDAHLVVGDYRIRGIAWALREVSGERLENSGFSVAISGDGTTVAHELGHSMGLHHDRAEGSRNAPFPYSHGFRYLDPTRPNPDYVWWDGTIMSNHRRGRGPAVFSNPGLRHPDDPALALGVAGEEPTSAEDGPADAARHLNEVGRIVANVRSRADADRCAYAISGDGDAVPAEGGSYRVRVETAPGCPWTASAGEWVEPLAVEGGTGSGEVEYRVSANEGFQRPVEVLVAGRVHARSQAGSRPVTPVCERSGKVRARIVSHHPEKGPQIPCEHLDFDAGLLAGIRHLYNPEQSRLQISEGYELKRGDFDGLTGVVRLDIRDMERVPAELFSGMLGLRFVEFRESSHEPTALQHIEPGAFRDLPGIRRLRINGHRVTVFEPGAFEGMPKLRFLEVYGDSTWSSARDHTPVSRLEPGALAGLSGLRSLTFTRHWWRHVDAGVFNGLDRLEELILQQNGIVSIDPGALDGLASLTQLDLYANRLAEMPAGIFDDLRNLEGLALLENRLREFEPGLFDNLQSLKRLYVGDNPLGELKPGLFRALGSLERLGLEDLGLRGLPAGLFEGLGSLDLLWLYDNRLGVLRSGAFDGLDSLTQLFAQRAGITALEPGAFAGLRRLRTLWLRKNALQELPPGALEGLGYLRALNLLANPGTPFTFAPTPVLAPGPASGGALQPVSVALDVSQGAPFHIEATLAADGGTLTEDGLPSDGELLILKGQTSSVSDDRPEVTPDGDAPVTVRLDGPLRGWVSGCPDDLLYGDTEDHCYRGVRLEAGPPLLAYGIEDRELVPARGPDTIDLAAAFQYFLGPDAEYAASSSDASVAAVAVEGGVLTVTPGSRGRATVTVTGTNAAGESRTVTFAVTSRMPMAPLFPSGGAHGPEGFVRLVNRSSAAGPVRIAAVDDSGARRGPVELRLRPNAAVHFNARDLEDGNAAKGLAEGVGAGEGDWRLEFDSGLDVEALAYARSGDGYVAGLLDVAPGGGDARRLATFIPADAAGGSGVLRVVNAGGSAAEVTVRGTDDAGASPGGAVRFTVAPGAARTLTAAQLERGGAGLSGSLGDGAGRWRLELESSAPIEAMSLLRGVPDGRLSNLSAGPVAPDGETGVHHVPLFPAASGGAGRQGLARVLNGSQRDGVVQMVAYDDAGARHGPLELSLEAGAAAHFSSDDLELGNAALGLSGGTGPGEGDWRLELESDLNIEVLAYARTADGFLTALQQPVAARAGRRVAATFNPGSNWRQVSRLRLVNPHDEPVLATVVGIDDRGAQPDRKGAARVTVPARGALTLTAAELEAGVESGLPEWQDTWEHNALGDGAGKWRLSVHAERPLLVMSLLESPTGHLINLSPAPR